MDPSNAHLHPNNPDQEVLKNQSGIAEAIDRKLQALQERSEVFSRAIARSDGIIVRLQSDDPLFELVFELRSRFVKRRQAVDREWNDFLGRIVDASAREQLFAELLR